MNKDNFINILDNLNLFEKEQTFQLKAIVNQHPYFQAARAIYLKTLKKQESFLYHNELKKTSAFITDRDILFNFITTDFLNTPKEETLVIKNDTINEEPLKEKTEEVKITTITTSLETLKENKKHSFNDWLELSSTIKPVVRKQKTEQENLIDNFIALNPKISKIDKSTPIEVKANVQNNQPQLMTETLAQVYLEQKKYDSAIKAYEILSLKYPEKSGFFADRINQIQILQKTK